MGFAHGGAGRMAWISYDASAGAIRSLLPGEVRLRPCGQIIAQREDLARAGIDGLAFMMFDPAYPRLALRKPIEDAEHKKCVRVRPEGKPDSGLVSLSAKSLFLMAKWFTKDAKPGRKAKIKMKYVGDFPVMVRPDSEGPTLLIVTLEARSAVEVDDPEE